MTEISFTLNGKPVVVSVEGSERLLDTLRYELWFDGEHRETGSRFLGLLPGESEEQRFRVADSSWLRIPGSYSYLLKAVGEDSLRTNDRVEGTLLWSVPEGEGRDPLPPWTVVPNPTREMCRIILPGPAAEDLHYQLLNLSGRVVTGAILPEGAGEMELRTGSLAPGSYVLMQLGSDYRLSLVILPR